MSYHVRMDVVSLFRCPPCHVHTTPAPELWLAGDYRPKQIERCASCGRTWYVFDVSGEPPIVVDAAEKPSYLSWDDYLEHLRAQQNGV